MLVRRIKVIKELEDMFDEGEILVEYGDYKGIFYTEDCEPNQNGVGFSSLAITKERFDKYFIELEPVEFKKTKRFLQIKDNLENEIDEIEMNIQSLKERKKELESLLK